MVARRGLGQRSCAKRGADIAPQARLDFREILPGGGIVSFSAMQSLFLPLNRHAHSFIFSEYVRNLDNIEKYNCERKMDYIKKGMGE